MSGAAAGPHPLFHSVAGLEWAHWEDESVLYDARSGQTHLLDAFSAEVLLVLQERAMAADTLTEHLADLLGSTAEASLRRKVDRALEQLLALGLIED